MDSHPVDLDYIGWADHRRTPPEPMNWTRVYAQHVPATAGNKTNAETSPRFGVAAGQGPAELQGHARLVETAWARAPR